MSSDSPVGHRSFSYSGYFDIIPGLNRNSDGTMLSLVSQVGLIGGDSMLSENESA